jgi:hypothetical protein
MKKLNIIGFAITGAWLLGVIALLYWKWEKLSELALNEWGDLFAGATAPLALIWLVIGYFLQGEELRLNTAALKAQEEELRNQVKETAILAANSARQAEASEQMAVATKEEYNRIAQRELADTQPVFRPRGGNEGRAPGLRYFTNIENVGAMVTKVNVLTSVEGLELRIDNAEVIPTGNTATLQASGEVRFPFEFSLSFHDSAGFPQTQNFRMNTLHSFERI